MVILLLMLATINPKWSFEVPTSVRHTSVRGERIGIALDSTVIVINRSTGTELVRVATHRGVIEGIGLMPGDTTCVVVSARYDSVSKIVVNTVAEVDLRTGEERQQLLLPPVQKQAWIPDVVQTVCGFTHDGAYVYTSTPQFLNNVPTLLEHGNYHKIDLTTFNEVPLERTTGPHGTIGLTNDDRIVSYSGSMGALNTSLRIPAWESYQTGLVMIVDQAKVSWKKIVPKIRIAPHSRFLYDSRYLYDTSSFAPSTYPELFGTVDLNGLCHNGKHYYSTPPITIRELGTNKIVRELALTTSDTTFKWWMQINDSLFIIAQDRHITCWQHDLEAEFPERIVHTLPDTITKNTCLPVTIKALPIGVPMKVSTSATMGSMNHGAVQFTQEGEQSVTLDLVSDGVVRRTDTHNIVVTPLQLHPKASWGMMIPEAPIDGSLTAPRFSNDGQHVAYASERWLAQAAINDTVLHSVRYDDAHQLLGVQIAPSGDVYIIRDSVGKTFYNDRGEGSTYSTLRTNVLHANGNINLASTLPYDRAGYMLERWCHPKLDASLGWVVTVLSKVISGEVSSASVRDALTGRNVGIMDETGHYSHCFDRDPVTQKMWWFSYPYAYRMNEDGTIDSTSFLPADKALFIVNGTYLLVDGKLYDRTWQQVGPDSTSPNFTGTFLGQRPFALERSKTTTSTFTRLRVRQIPSGMYIDSIDFDVQIEGIDATADGKQIALTFSDGTLQVFATDSLFTHHLLVAPPTDTTTISARGLVVAPHPLTDGATITIERWNNMPLTYHLSDMNGVEMLQGTIAQSSNVIWLDRRDASSQRLSPGVYLLWITDGSTTKRTTIVVQ